MALNVNKIPHTGNSGFVPQEVLEAGVYPARVVQIIDLGLQKALPWKGKEKSPVYQINLTYELVDEFMKDEDGEDILDKPRWISEIINVFSLQAERAKSTQRYLALDPDQVHEGDFSKTLGYPCNVALVVDEGKNGERNKVGTISAMRAKDAEKCPELVNEPKVFDLSDPDLEVFLTLPEWLQGKIKENLDFDGSPLDKLLNGEEKKAAPKQGKKQEEPAFDEDEDDDVPY